MGVRRALGATLTSLIVAAGLAAGLGGPAAGTDSVGVDPDFGGDGVDVPAVGLTSPRGEDVAVGADGSIVTAGWGTSDLVSGHCAGVVTRHLPDGTLDPTFAGGVVVSDPFHFDPSGSAPDDLLRGEVWRAVATEPGGSVYVGGALGVACYSAGDSPSVIRRLSDTGSLEATFRADLVAIERTGVVRGIAVQDDGKVVAVANESAGSATADFDVLRLTPDLELDPSFGGSGVARVDVGPGTGLGHDDDAAYAVAIQADGKIVVAGASFDGGRYVGVVVRLHADGRIDPSFGDGGVVRTLDALAFSSVQTRADGTVVAVGMPAFFGGPVVVMELTSTGGVTRIAQPAVEGFGVGGSFGCLHSFASDCGGPEVVLAGDGSMFVSGQAFGDDGGHPAILRLRDTLEPDTTFRVEGVAVAVVAERGASMGFADAIAFGRLGEVVVGGTALVETTSCCTTEVLVARFGGGDFDCAGIAREVVVGDQPTYDDGPLSTFPNDHAVCAAIWVPRLDGGFVPQGIARDGDRWLVSGYLWDGTKGGADNHCLLVAVDAATGEDLGAYAFPDSDLEAAGAELGSAAACTHGGGVAVDASGRVWVADTGHLFALRNDFTGGGNPIEHAVRLVDVAGSFLVDQRDDGALWIGDFGRRMLFRYAVDDLLVASRLSQPETGRLVLPEMPQGGTIRGDEVWISASTSTCGELHRLPLAAVDEPTLQVLAAYGFGPGVEEIAFDGDRLAATFEAGTTRYDDAFFPVVATFDPRLVTEAPRCDRLTFQGEVRYEDAWGNDWPAAGVTVEVLAERLLGDEVRARTVTDRRGRYSAPVELGDGDSVDAYVRVRPDYVRDDGLGFTFDDPCPGVTCAVNASDLEWRSEVHEDVSSGVVDERHVAPAHTPFGQALAIQDALRTGVEFVERAGGRGSELLAELRAFEVVYPAGRQTLCGIGPGECVTHWGFAPGFRKKLFVTDDDFLDWDVLLHEFTHFVGERLGFDDSPGGSHDLELGTQLANENKDEGIRLAWSEAVADYFGVRIASLGFPRPYAGFTCGPGSEPTARCWTYDDVDPEFAFGQPELSHDLDRPNGLAGEDSEASILGFLHDLGSGGDDVDLLNRSGFATLNAGEWLAFLATTDPTTFDEFVAVGRAHRLWGRGGECLAEMHGMAPADFRAVLRNGRPPTLSWTPGNGTSLALRQRNDAFRLTLFAGQGSFAPTPAPLVVDLDTTTWTPTREQWRPFDQYLARTVPGLTTTVWAVVEGSWTAHPATGPYRSCVKVVESRFLPFVPRR